MSKKKMRTIKFPPRIEEELERQSRELDVFFREHPEQKYIYRPVSPLELAAFQLAQLFSTDECEGCLNCSPLCLVVRSPSGDKKVSFKAKMPLKDLDQTKEGANKLLECETDEEFMVLLEEME